MANQDTKDKKVAPKLPGLNFGKKPSMFSGGSMLANRKFTGAKFTPPQIRTTQSKGAGGK